MRPDLAHERALGGLVAGIDEAGRGPLAGPVVAAALVFVTPPPPELHARLDDSKKLAPRARDRAFDALRASGCVAFALGAASVAEIDRLNILQATFLAMRRAFARLPLRPDAALIDGPHVPPGLACPARALVDGDARSLSIAAASILAKVTRDRLMDRLDARHPGFLWDRNRGYGTAAHLQALGVRGPTAHHRLSFAPLAQRRLAVFG